MADEDDSTQTEWTRHVRWRDLGRFLWAGPRRLWRGIDWVFLALINLDRWDRRAIAQGWERAKARIQRYYLLPVFVVAAVFVPVWIDLLGEVIGNLVDQLGAEPPPVTEAAARRAYYYSVGLTITGLGALLAAPFILIKAWVNERNTAAAEQGLITERFTRAVEQLGAEKVVKIETPLPGRDARGRFQRAKESIERTEANIEVRLGAIYALERIAEDSERDHIPVMETLCAYVRENAPASGARDLNLAEWEPRPDAMTEAEAALREAEFEARFGMEAGNVGEWARALPGPRADVQAALTVIGRRSAARIAHERDPRRDRPFALDLRGTKLQRADLSGAALAHARLDGARLEGAVLFEARLEGAVLLEARLEGAFLAEARLEGAFLGRARLKGARLNGARLEGARLCAARLEGARLDGARLEGADLAMAQLEGAVLVKARLEGTGLVGAWLEGVDLDGARLKSAVLIGWFCARTRLRFADFTDVTTLDPESVELAFGVRAGMGLTVLPEGVPYPDHWHVAAEAERDRPEIRRAFEADYRAWLAAGCPTGADWRDLP